MIDNRLFVANSFLITSFWIKHNYEIYALDPVASIILFLNCTSVTMAMPHPKESCGKQFIAVYRLGGSERTHWPIHLHIP